MKESRKNIKFILLPFAIASLVLLSVWSKAFSEEPPVEVQAEQLVYLEKEGRLSAEGKVVITQKDLKITCNRAILFLETQEAYAEGEVKVYEGPALFESEFLKYNFKTRKGSQLEGDFRMSPFYGRVDTAERISRDEYLAEKPYITTCDLEKPHYRIQSKSAKVYLGERVVAKNVVFHVGNIPLLYLPFYSHNIRDNRMQVTIIPGYGKEWGWYALTAWRFYLNEGAKGWIHLDYRELKGLATGLDYRYETGEFGNGLLRYYHLDERDKVAEEFTETERYRAQLRHRWDINERTNAILEYNYLTDEDVTKDYFEREYEIDPEPKSILSIVHTEPEYSLFLQAEKKTSLFITETERLPELTLSFRRIELGSTNFYYKGETVYTNLNLIESDQWTGEQDTQRTDTVNEISYQSKLPLFNLSLTPRLGVEETFYTIGADDKDFLRTSFFGGWDLTTKFYRIYEVEGEFLDMELHRLRHVITPRIEYNWRHEPTVPPEDILQFDDTDELTEEEFYTISLENKLQTKRPTGPGGKMESIDLAIFTTSIDYFPKINEEELSDLKLDLDLNPYPWLSLLADGEYNTYADKFSTGNLGAKVSVGPWQAVAEKRYTRETSDELITNLIWQITPLWKFSVYGRYEFEGKDIEEQQYIFTRDLHCWFVDFGFNMRDTEDVKDDVTFWVIFRLKAFPETPFKFKGNYDGWQ